MRPILFGLVVLLASSSMAQQAGDDGAEVNTEALGKRLYDSNCAICHGFEGVGGRGPSLTRAKLVRAPTVAALSELIEEGIPGTEMPAIWWLNASDTIQLIKYVIDLGRLAEENVPGDIAKGRSLYEKNDCAQCHIVAGKGRSFGPELTEVGLRRNAAYLREALVRPAANTPEGYMVVLAVSSDGNMVEGARLNEDAFSIQLRDANDRFYSFRKDNLRRLDKQPRRSLMPGYADRLTSEALQDLVAYMASLKGEQ